MSNELHPGQKRAKSSYFDNLLQSTTALLEAKAAEQIASAKVNEWKFDPRAKVNTIPSLQDVFVMGLGGQHDIIVDSLLEHNTKDKAERLHDYCKTIAAQIENFDKLSEEEVLGFGINVLFQSIAAIGHCPSS